ncbi:MAG: hypothetical protein HKN61_06615 [Flavobacteriaceae bacterium]|nr:hypothetical protein [Flavobacteriaceae bacterium]
MNIAIKSYITDLFQFLKSTDFSKAILIGFGVTIPVLTGIYTGRLEIGLAIAFGAFWCSPSDVSGRFRNKVVGILLATALIMIVTFMAGYFVRETWWLLLVLGILTFGISYISIYGFRASLISFSGLLALVLSFAHDAKVLLNYEYTLLVGLGGIWYLLLMSIREKINPKGALEEALNNTYELSADFLDIRRRILTNQGEQDKLQRELLGLQTQLTEQHETLREILLVSRKSSGQSQYLNERLLILVALVDILESAVAHPVNYSKMEKLAERYSDFVGQFGELIGGMSRQLYDIAQAGNSVKKLPSHSHLNELSDKLEQEIESCQPDFESYLTFKNLLEYLEKQLEKINRIKWILGNPGSDEIEMVDKKLLKQFKVNKEYDPKVLLRNLNFRSAIFKHSLRLAVTMMVGYGVGWYYDFQNPYWILLTIIVIMRPNYGLTKKRFKERIVGTLIGGALAVGVVYLVRDVYVYAVLGVGSLVLAFSMLQRNYRTAAVFITLSVIFIYAIIRPDVLTVIQYRLLDTLIGAGLSLVSVLFLWPAWGFLEIKDSILGSVRANKKFLEQIAEYYRQKGAIPPELRLSRKEAFLQSSQLNTAYQQMAQEPESKQLYLEEIYKLVVLNHSFLTALASLSTYFQTRPTTKASEFFDNAVAHIDENLRLLVCALEDKEFDCPEPDTKPRDFEIPAKIEAMTELDALGGSIHPSNEQEFQEAHLVMEQLRWLQTLSVQMMGLTSKINFEQEF